MKRKKSPIISGRMSRKRFLRSAVFGAGVLLSGFIDSKAFADVLEKKPKAKSMIQLWMWGGPSHIDTFDPKPAAGKDYTGGLSRTIDTNVPGIKINGTLPLLAQQADKYAILRGMTHNNNGHETAAYMVQTGRKPGEGLVYPGIGAVVSYFKGKPPLYKSPLPPYITLTTPQGRFSECGFMGGKYKPFSTGGDPNREPFAVEGIVSETVNDDRQKSRKDFLKEIDSFARSMMNDPLVKVLDAGQQEAYSVILGEARKAFLLNVESKETRDLYGRNTFGQSCLLARKLVQQGVPYITINYRGWDTHKKHFETMNQKLPELDRGMAALISELASFGLLDSTIVWWSGEFGRSPKVAWEDPWYGGRHHYGKAFSAVVAGGGFKGGTVVGRTDDTGENVAERPIYPWDLIASFYELLGIEKDAKIPNVSGPAVYANPFTAGAINSKETGGILSEIMPS